MKASQCMLCPPLSCGVLPLRRKKYLTPSQVILYIVRARIGREIALSSYEFVCVFGSLGDFSYLCTRKRNERPSGDAGCLTLRDL